MSTFSSGRQPDSTPPLFGVVRFGECPPRLATETVIAFGSVAEADQFAQDQGWTGRDYEVTPLRFAADTPPSPSRGNQLDLDGAPRPGTPPGRCLVTADDDRTPEGVPDDDAPRVVVTPWDADRWALAVSPGSDVAALAAAAARLPAGARFVECFGDVETVLVYRRAAPAATGAVPVPTGPAATDAVPVPACSAATGRRPLEVGHPLALIRAERGWSYQRVARIVAARARQRGIGVAAERQKVWRWEHCGVVPERLAQLCLAEELGVPAATVETQPWPAWLPTKPASCAVRIARLTEDLRQARRDLDASRRALDASRRASSARQPAGVGSEASGTPGARRSRTCVRPPPVPGDGVPSGLAGRRPADVDVGAPGTPSKVTGIPSSSSSSR